MKPSRLARENLAPRSVPPKPGTTDFQQRRVYDSIVDLIANPDIKIIGIEPKSREHTLSGIKKISDLPDEFKPKILDYSLIDDIIAVDDQDAYQAGIRLARTEGIMVGPTTGAVLHAAQQFGAENSGHAVVISPDSATKYLSAYAKYLEDS